MRREGKLNSAAIKAIERLYKNFLIRLTSTVRIRLKRSIVTIGK
jgi:hypothetical protein